MCKSMYINKYSYLGELEDELSPSFKWVIAHELIHAIIHENRGTPFFYTEISSDEWNQMIDINLSGAFKLTKAVLPYMVHEKRGKIINIASIWGECGGSCEVHYSAAKAGLIGMTKALAKELAPSGITVNSISPGVILTDMTTHFDESTMQSLKEEIPLGRIGSPKDIAGVVSFLASDDADYITGQDIPVNGGMYI